MSKRDNELLMEDRLEVAEKIEKYTRGLNFKMFSGEDKTVDAVIRNFEIIGEAANRISSDVKKQSPEIGWGKIIGFRISKNLRILGYLNKMVLSHLFSLVRKKSCDWVREPKPVN